MLTADASADLQKAVQEFVRGFGLLNEGSTPCGQKLSTPHAHAIMIIFQSASAISQTELRDHLRVNKSNVARLCQKMERAGHIIQLKNPNDERVRHLTLTAKGEKIATALSRASRLKFAGITAQLTVKENEIVLRGVSILNKAIAKTHFNEIQD